MPSLDENNTGWWYTMVNILLMVVNIWLLYVIIWLMMINNNTGWWLSLPL
jgi:hypothetical protein